MKRLLMIALLLLCSSAFALESGDSGAPVADLQSALIREGFLEGSADGVYGAKTEQAVRRARIYLAAVGAEGGDPDSGNADDALIRQLNGGLPKKPETISIGDTGAPVSRLQTRLRVLGYLTDTVDGGFGSNTQRAVMVYQHFAKLPLTGAADAQSQQSLFSDGAVTAAYPALTKEMSGKRVLALQQRLVETGFMSTSGNGHFGTATQNGVKALQTYIKRSGAFDEKLDSSLLPIDFNGVADPLVQAILFSADFPACPALTLNDEGQEVRRLQTRLICLEYLSGAADGGYGQKTYEAVKAFQARNGLKADGKAGKETIRLLFSEKARAAAKPYQITVDISAQTVTIHALDETEAYTVYVSSFPCSTGKPSSPTQTGAFSENTGPGPEWKAYNNGKYYVRYVFEVTGRVRIHSIPFDAQGGTADKSWLTKLGEAVTAGTIMISEENARWIWERCPSGTPVRILS